MWQSSNKQTNSMEQSPYSEAESHSVKKFPPFMIPEGPLQCSLVPTLGQIKAIRTFRRYVPTIHFNIVVAKLNYVPCHEDFHCLVEHHTMTHWGSGGTAPRIINLGTRQWWVVTFTPRYTFDRRLGGPQSRSERGGEERKSLPLPGMELRSVTWATLIK
jgi:hypothetical protein